MSDEENSVSETKRSQDSKNVALLTWVGTLIFGFIPGLVLYLVKKDDPYVLDQSKESLNWSITAIFAYVIAALLSFIVIGAFLIPIISICHVVFCIMGALAASKGNDFRVPFAVRLIK